MVARALEAACGEDAGKGARKALGRLADFGSLSGSINRL
jgi:hypothetical protein